MPEKSNALQSELQRGDLNVHTNLSAIRHAQCTFTTWARAASFSRQSALIAWHNTFKFCTLFSSIAVFKHRTGMHTFSLIKEAPSLHQFSEVHG